MGRQYRPPRQGGSPGGIGSGGSFTYVSPQVVSSSSTVIAVPNYGITDISTWAAGEYVMDVPVAGLEKVILSVSSSSLARVIRMSTGTSVKVNGDGTAHTQITFNATVGQCVTLLGLNSTTWVIKAMHPPTAVNSTGIVSATS